MDQAVPAANALVGRQPEMQVLDDLLDRVHDRGGCLVVRGGPGVGKSALLEEAAAHAGDRGMLVLKATGVPSEAPFPFAGLHQLLLPVLRDAESLPAPQRDAILAAFGLTESARADLFLTALAALDLVAENAARAPVVIIADDAQWLDRSTRDVLAFLARRLEFEPILLITAILDGFESSLDVAAPVLHLEALPPPAAAALLDTRAPDLPDAVRERLLEEAAGNPLALVELPIAYGQHGKIAPLPGWLPLTTRLERSFAARASDLPPTTRTALLVAALNDGALLSEVLDATALLMSARVAVDVLTPAAGSRLVDIGDIEYMFRHPLMRAAIRQQASISQRHAAHAALADVLSGQPERRAWHRAASVLGPDESVAGELEATAERAQRRGGTAVAVAALQRAADLSEGPRRGGRLLRAAELALELGRRDLVMSLLADAGTLDLEPREHARAIWIRESFGDVPADDARVAALAVAADRAAADGDTDIALKLLSGAAQRCWWVDSGQAARDDVVATAERLDIDGSDPRLLVILAFAAPVGRGGIVIDRLSGLAPTTGSTRLAGLAATAVGAFDLATAFLGASAGRLRDQGRLGLLARTLIIRAWSSAQLADLGTAIPAAEEGCRLAGETAQPLIQATGEAVQALLAALRGDHEAAEALASQAERSCVPVRASAVLAAAQLARGLSALGGGRPADALEHLRRIHDPADPAFHYAIRCHTIGDLAEAAVRSGFHYAIRCHTIGDLAEAAVRSGDPGRITSILLEMESAARQTPSPSLHAGLRYARALMADDAGAGAFFDAALRSDAGTQSFTRARIQLAWGEWLHQQRQDAAARPCAPPGRPSMPWASTRGPTGHVSSSAPPGRPAVRGPWQRAIGCPRRNCR